MMFLWLVVMMLFIISECNSLSREIWDVTSRLRKTHEKSSQLLHEQSAKDHGKKKIDLRATGQKGLLWANCQCHSLYTDLSTLWRVTDV